MGRATAFGLASLLVFVAAGLVRDSHAHPLANPGAALYGWDSYFIVRGLLRDERFDLARDMTDDLLYEVEHYGMVLNANRSYFLTHSQPPLLSRMVMALYERDHDLQRLRQAWPTLVKYYAYWQGPTHLTSTGLSRYFDSGHGPAPCRTLRQPADG